MEASAWDRAVRLNFDNSSGGTGGLLVLNGHDSSIGALFSENGAGVVRNGAADDAVLGIDGYFAGSFSGTIEDGGAGSLALDYFGFRNPYTFGLEYLYRYDLRSRETAHLWSRMTMRWAPPVAGQSLVSQLWR